MFIEDIVEVYIELWNEGSSSWLSIIKVIIKEGGYRWLMLFFVLESAKYTRNGLPIVKQ